MILTNCIEATRDQFRSIAKDYPKGEPVVMINLLKFRSKTKDGKRTGQQAYAQYSKDVAPLLAKVGGKLLWSGVVNQTVIGSKTGKPDMVLLVEYPSVDKFVEMAASPEYAAIAHNRIEALEYGGLLASKAVMNLL